MAPPLDDPISVDGRTLQTLRDAADYIVTLPEWTSRRQHWQTAVRELMMAAERGWIIMLAEMAMKRAINHHGTEQEKPDRHEPGHGA